MIAPSSRFVGRSVVRVSCYTMLLSAFPLGASAEDFASAIHAYLQQCGAMKRANVGIVVGIVDEQGSKTVSYGKLDHGTDREVDGDTLFEIGSVTKTFTALLLQDMVERGEMKLDDPVAKYLPESVKLPSHGGKEITLLHLATHTSGLPRLPDNLDPKRADNPFADYSVEQLYAFLSSYKLTRDPGAKLEYSDTGMALLGLAIALKAGMSYELLMVDRICRPLAMDSTRITLPAELEARRAQGHSAAGYAVPKFDFKVMAPVGAICSTANDLLKYVAANLGLTSSCLTPLFDKTHAVRFHESDGYEIGLAWVSSPQRQGTKIIWHNGATYGCVTFVGFDKTRGRGVVILSNSRNLFDVGTLGNFLLESEWQSDRRPAQVKVSRQILDSYAGQYQRSSDPASRMRMIWQYLASAPKAAIYFPAGCSLAALVVLFRRAGSFHGRAIIVGCAVLITGGLAAIIAAESSRVADAPSKPVIGIRREGDRLFAQGTEEDQPSSDGELPPTAGELLPESEDRFFERLSGKPMTFSRNAQGNVSGLTVHYRGNPLSFAKVSDQSPAAPKPFQPRVAIRLDTKLLDACVGHYEFPPNATSQTATKIKFWRVGDQLFGQARGETAMRGAFEIYPESESTFFIKIDGAQLTFIKNDQGEVTAVQYRMTGYPREVGKRFKDN